jgi:hypothetical protein
VLCIHRVGRVEFASCHHCGLSAKDWRQRVRWTPALSLIEQGCFSLRYVMPGLTGRSKYVTLLFNTVPPNSESRTFDAWRQSHSWRTWVELATALGKAMDHCRQ